MRKVNVSTKGPTSIVVSQGGRYSCVKISEVGCAEVIDAIEKKPLFRVCGGSIRGHNIEDKFLWLPMVLIAIGLITDKSDKKKYPIDSLMLRRVQYAHGIHVLSEGNLFDFSEEDNNLLPQRRSA